MGREQHVGLGESYRTCSECGGDCEPVPSAVDGLGVRVAFVCPAHGVHGVLDPFDDRRSTGTGVSVEDPGDALTCNELD